MTYTKRDVAQALDNILESVIFQSSPRSQIFLKYVVTETLEGRGDRINGTTIAQDVFEKDANFDPSQDTIVRVGARRIRNMLRDYYLEHPERDPVTITMPKGGYRASFEERAKTPLLTGPTKTPSSFYKRALLALLVFITAGGALYTLTGKLTKNDQTQQQAELLQVENYPRLAVLQFDNKSGNSSNDFLEGGLQMRLMHDLSRFKTMRPLKYNRSYEDLIKNDIGSFDYAVTGVILSSEAPADMFIKLTDLENMTVVKNHRVTYATNDVDYVEAFEDIILGISEDLAAMDGEIMKAELLKIQSKPESIVYTDLTALECFTKFFDPLMSPNPEIYERNYTCFKTLSETYPKDSTIAAAYGMTMQWGVTSSEEEFGARALDPTMSEERAGAILKQAVALDPSDSFAQIALAYYYLDMPDIKGALVAANTAHLSNPADTDALSLLSTVLAYDGQWDRALMKADEARARDPQAFYVYYRTYFMKALADNDKVAMAEYCAELREHGGSSADVFCYLSALANDDLERLPEAESYLEEYAREVGTDKITAINDYLKSNELRAAARLILSNANVAINETAN